MGKGLNAMREERGVLRHAGMELLYRVGGLKGQGIGELFQVGYTSVSQERRRLRDRRSNDRNAQDLFKRLLSIGKCNDCSIAPYISFL